MTKERIGKIQRWILINAYQNDRLTKAHVLGDFLGLETTEYRDEHYGTHFKALGSYYEGYDWESGAKSNRAHASYSRTVYNMKRKNLINLTKFYGPNTDEFTLTEKGRIKAERILNVKP